MDKYVYETFLAFTASKIHIVFNGKYWFGKLAKHYTNNRIRNIFMYYDTKQYHYDAVDLVKFDDKEKVNLFRPEVIFNIFDNVEEITIYSTRYDGFFFYGFSLLYLLEILIEYKSRISLNKVIIKAIRYGSHLILDKDKKEKESWISWLWSSSSSILITKYKENGFNIHINDVVINQDKYKEDIVIIETF